MHPVATTQNGMVVYVDLVASAVASQIAFQPHLLTITANLLSESTVANEGGWLVHDAGKAIGNCTVVKTTPTDTICYAQPAKSTGFVRLVKNRKFEPTHFISLEFETRDESSLNLRQIVVGEPIPAVPTSDNTTARSRTFWDNHAWIFESQPIKGNTLTKECPW